MPIKRVVVLRDGDPELPSATMAKWGLSAKLSPSGENQAREAARKFGYLFGEADRFVTNPLICSQQTLHTIMITLGYKLADLDKAIKFCTGLWTNHPEYYIRSHPNETLASWASRDMDVAMFEGQRIYRTVFDDILNDLAEDGTALCISPGGPIDLLLSHIRGAIKRDHFFGNIRDLRSCEGFVAHFEHGRIADKPIGVEELRF